MRRRMRALAVGIGLAVLATLLMAAWIWAVRDRLPEQVATHWGITGPDGFVAPDAVWESLLLSMGLTLALGLVVVLSMPAHGSSLNLAAGITAGLGSFLAVVFGGTVALQGSFAPDHPMLLHMWWLPPALLLALAIGVVASALTGPPAPRPKATKVPPRSARLPERDRRRTWAATVGMPMAMALIVLIPMVIFIVIGAGMRSWALPLMLTLVAAAPLAALWRWDITVDDGGVTCRGYLGRPTVHHFLTEIEQASALDHVGAFTYGGPGLRATRNGERLVLRGGPALQLQLSDGTEFVVTIPDADVAARIINTLIAEQRDTAPTAAR